MPEVTPMEPVKDIDTTNFTDTFENAVEFFGDAHTIMKDFYTCLPEAVQTLLFMFFVISFGFAFLLKIVKTLT